MSPIVKKVLAAVAVKKVVEAVQERRKPKRSVFSKASPLLVLGVAGGGLYYLYRHASLRGGKPADTAAQSYRSSEPPAPVTGVAPEQSDRASASGS